MTGISMAANIAYVYITNACAKLKILYKNS